MLVMMPTMNRFFSPDATEMLDLLEMLYQPTPPPGSRLVDPSVRQAMEIYVAGKHSARLRDPGFWNSPVMQQGIGKRLQPTADGVAARHPSVSPEELARATTTIAPELERLRQRRARESFADLTGIRRHALSGRAAPADSAAQHRLGVDRAGWSVHAHARARRGHAQRSRDRPRALAGRVLVAWAPAIAWLLYLASSPKVQGFVPIAAESSARHVRDPCRARHRRGLHDCPAGARAARLAARHLGRAALAALLDSLGETDYALSPN